MQKNRLWAIGGTVIAVLIIALLVVPSFIDWSKYQSIARAKVKAATGYDLQINGSLSMALLPSPHAKVTDVILKKPVAGRDDAMLTLEQADIRLSFFPLLVGKVKIASVTLEKPVVNLITYKAGIDNFTPAKTASAQPAVDPVTGQPVPAQTGASGQDISINHLNIKDGLITIRDDEAKTTKTIGIDDLSVKADSLSGPFDGKGKVSYNDAKFKLGMNTGGYKQGETLPVQIDIEDTDGRAHLKWSGVAKMQGDKEYQGELDLKFSDLSSLLKDAGLDAAVPDLGGDSALTGMLTANPNTITLTNGALKLGKTKFKLRADLQDLKTDAKNIVIALETNDLLDIDELVKVADKVASDQKKADKKEASKAQSEPAAARTVNVKPLFDTDFELPRGLRADISLKAPGIDYHDKKSGPFNLRAVAQDGLGKGQFQINEIPGGGSIQMLAELAQKGVIQGTIKGDISSLKETFADWLDVVDDDVLDQPGMPTRLDIDGTYKISGYTATASFNTLSLGETKLTGTLGYTAATRPYITANLNGNVLTLPSGKQEIKGKIESKPGEVQEGKAPDVDVKDIKAPQLPFDVKFDIALGRLAKDDMVLTEVTAAGAYTDNKTLTLSKGEATVNGGTLNATGTIGDIDALSGININAGLRTSDLESFVGAMTGKPMTLEQKIGDFAGTLKARGDKNKMAVDVTAAARGYTISGTGTLDDPFSPELPGTINVRIRHADLTQAIRVFSPAFNNSGPQGANQPVDLAGVAKINGKVYEFDSLKGMLGSSDIAGAVKADLSGAAPSITASLTSTKMDLGSLLGVDNKSGKVSAKSSTASSGAYVEPVSASGNWSREPLDTGLMKAMTLDINLAAKTLIYGTWTLTDAKAGIKLKDGVLKVSPLSGGLYDGSFDATVNAQTEGAGKALSIDAKADVKDVSVGPFLQALTSSAKRRADGKGSVSFNVTGAGISSGALMNSLNGEANVKTQTLTIYGMDIDKLAANIVEAFDGGWKGVLAGITTQGFSGGKSEFKDVDHKFPIANGTMAVNAFRMETTSGNAIVVTNGTVSFGSWQMNLQSDVQVTQPKDVPVVSIRLSGPLGSPVKSVNSQALDNLIRGKVGDKVQDLVKDKLGDSPLGNALGQFLGGSNTAPKPATVTPAAPAPASTQTPAPLETAPATVPQTKEKTPQEQLLEGVLNRLGQ